MIAVMLVRDEADILAYTIRHLFAQGVDRVVVADNLSSDGSGEIARDAGATVVVDDDPAHRQADKTNALIAAHAADGEWVLPVDADELWSNLEKLDDSCDIATAAPFVHVPTAADAVDLNPYTRVEHRQTRPEPHPKTAFRHGQGRLIDEGNHYVIGAGRRTEHLLDVRHFQYRTLEQATRKVRNGSKALGQLGRHHLTGQHWHDLAKLDDDELAGWWQHYQAQPVVFDPAPWLP